MSKEIEHIRDWVRTNGEMSEDGKSITYDCKAIEEVIEQALNMRIVSHTLMTKEWANSREKTAKIREQIAIEKFIDVYWNEKYTPTLEEIKERLKLH